MNVPSRLFLNSRQCGSWPARKSFQPPAVYQEDIQPSVVVVVVKSQAATGGFEQILVLVLTAVNGFDGQAGFFYNVDEADTQRSAFYRRFRTLRRRLRLGVIAALDGTTVEVLVLLRSRQRENVGKGKHQRCAAQRSNELAAIRLRQYSSVTAATPCSLLRRRRLHIRVHMPGHAFVRNFRMLAQKIQRISRAPGIHLFGGEQRGLLGGFFFIPMRR